MGRRAPVWPLSTCQREPVPPRDRSRWTPPQMARARARPAARALGRRSWWERRAAAGRPHPHRAGSGAGRPQRQCPGVSGGGAGAAAGPLLPASLGMGAGGVEAFVAMMAVAGAAARNTLTAYEKDLTDAWVFWLAAMAATWRTRRPKTSKPIFSTWASGACRPPQPRAGAPRCAVSIASPWARAGAPTIRLRRVDAPKQGRPLPKVLSRDDIERADLRRRAPGTARGPSPGLSGRADLRRGPARLRGAGATARRHRPRPHPPHRQGQGRQGTARAAERDRPHRHPRLSAGRGPASSPRA